MLARSLGKKRLLYLVTEDWYFWSHRLNLARAAKAEGYEIYVATSIQGLEAEIIKEGFHPLPLRYFKREGFKIIRELKALWELWKVYRKVKPSLVHHVALKPILYGSLIARLARIPRVINTAGGMGYIFTRQHLRARLLQYLITRFYKVVNHPHRHALIVQNKDDLELWRQHARFSPAQLFLVPGSGVDPLLFQSTPEPKGPLTVLCAARLLWDKGIGEYVAAAELIKKQGVEARFLLCGAADPVNPAAISEEKVKSWQAEGFIEWGGQRTKMEELYREAHIVVLPSYREGMPKVLLEAASCERAIVTTDVPGCRELIIHEKNGLIVPARDPKALAEAIQRLLEDSKLRHRLAHAARQDILLHFSDSKINNAMLEIYRGIHKSPRELINRKAR